LGFKDSFLSGAPPSFSRGCGQIVMMAAIGSIRAMPLIAESNTVLGIQKR
jgi:hypothetical protein